MIDRVSSADPLALHVDQARISYDHDGAIGPACAEIALVLDSYGSDIVDAFLNTFLADRTVREAIGKSDDLVAEFRTQAKAYVHLKFAAPLSPEWINAARYLAARCHKSGIPLHVYLSAMSIGHSRLIMRIAADVGGDAVRACRIGDVIQRLAIFEAAVMGEQIAAREKEQARHARGKHAELFEDEIGAMLHATTDLGSGVRKRATGASMMARGMLGKASEVAAAAEQSAVAMREAAQTAAGLIRAIEDARSEVEAAAEIATRASSQAGARRGHVGDA